jgi:hypothetical protein
VVCLVYGSVGLSEEQIRGLQVLLCDEAENWRRREIGGPSERYRVELTAFGNLLVARLTWENPAGSVVAARSAQINDLEQLPAGLLRLMRSLRSREEAARAQPEAPPPPAPPGRFQGDAFVEATLGGYSFPGVKGNTTSAALGASLGYSFLSPQWAWLLTGRVVFGNERTDRNADITMLGIALGGRRMGSPEGLTSLVGGGFSLLAFFITPPQPEPVPPEENRHPYHSIGLGAYLEGGLGLRNKKGGVLLGGRLDLPFFRVRQPDFSRWDPNRPPGSRNEPTVIPGSSMRVIPISLFLSGQFR